MSTFAEDRVNPKLVKLVEALAEFDTGPGNKDGLLNIQLFLLFGKEVYIQLTFDAFMQSFGTDCEVLPKDDNGYYKVYKEAWGMVGFYALARYGQIKAASLDIPGPGVVSRIVRLP